MSGEVRFPGLLRAAQEESADVVSVESPYEVWNGRYCVLATQDDGSIEEMVVGPIEATP